MPVPFFTSPFFTSKTDAPGLAGYSGVQLSAYTFGVVSAPVLTTFKDSGVDPQSSLTLDSTGGILNLPVLLNTGIQGVTLNGIIPAAQTISAFNPIQPQHYGLPCTVTPPTASSELAVVVTVLSGPATISGNVVTFTGAGNVVLAANQPGNLFYTAASQVTTSVDVLPGGQGG